MNREMEPACICHLTTQGLPIPVVKIVQGVKMCCKCQEPWINVVLTCFNGHDEIKYRGKDCPLCYVIGILEDLCAVQDGPPTSEHESVWKEVMDDAEEIVIEWLGIPKLPKK